MSMSLYDGFLAYDRIPAVRVLAAGFARSQKRGSSTTKGAPVPGFQQLPKNKPSPIYGSSGSNSSMLLKTTKSASLGRKSFQAELFVSVATTTSASTADVLEEILWTR